MSSKCPLSEHYFNLFDTNDIVGKSSISDVKEERDELADLLNYDE